MTEEEIIKIAEKLSFPRMASYADLGFGGDQKELIYAYFAIQEIASHFFVPIQILEISLRNSIHYALDKRFSKSGENAQKWYNILPISTESKKLLKTAKDKTEKDCGESYTDNDLIPNITFGFWVHMLDDIHSDNRNNKRFHFWQFELDNVFPGRGSKKTKEIFASLKRINFYRNRLYHHEPAWKSSRVKTFKQAVGALNREYEKTLEIIGWLSPEKLKCMELLGYKSRFKECCGRHTEAGSKKKLEGNPKQEEEIEIGATLSPA